MTSSQIPSTLFSGRLVKPSSLSPSSTTIATCHNLSTPSKHLRFSVLPLLQHDPSWPHQDTHTPCCFLMLLTGPPTHNYCRRRQKELRLPYKPGMPNEKTWERANRDGKPRTHGQTRRTKVERCVALIHDLEDSDEESFVCLEHVRKGRVALPPLLLFLWSLRHISAFPSRASVRKRGNKNREETLSFWEAGRTESEEKNGKRRLGESKRGGTRAFGEQGERRRAFGECG